MHNENRKREHRNYEALAPNDKITNGEEYFEVLDFGLEKDNIFNIALTGPYGAGKSSVINSYLQQRPRVKDQSIRISLATFDKDADVKEEQIKSEILKQLFYKVDAKKISDSRYRKIYKKYIQDYLFSAFWIVATIAVITGLFWPGAYANIYKNIYESGSTLNASYLLIFGGLFWVGVLVFLWMTIASVLMKFSGKVFVKHIEAATGSVDFENEGEEFSFNKNTDEILYFFESTNYRNVFIEDIDRFKNCVSVFTALREVNNLINSYENIRGKVTFVYALRDDVFNEAIERTKFFELMVPIIPYINSTNSGEILHNKLDFVQQEDGSFRSLQYDISSRYVTLVSPYISDMRVLTNICNEFFVYKATLQGNQKLELNDTQFFSMMIYKNLYPADFALLEEEKGLVKDAFVNKRDFVSKQIKIFDVEIEKCEDEIIAAQNEFVENIREFKYLMLGCFVLNRKGFSPSSINVNETNYPIEKFMEDSFDFGVLNNQSVVIKSVSGYDINISNMNQYFQKYGIEYSKRYTRLLNSKQNYINKIKEQIAEIEQKKQDILSMTLKTLLCHFDITDVLSSDVRNNDLLTFMLRQGFINEHYSDYINYFHPNTISQDEMNFVLGVRNHSWNESYNFKILNKAAVFDKLDIREFEQKEILNFDMVDFILENPNCIEARSHLISQLAEYSSITCEFIKAYIERGINAKELVELLIVKNGLFWRFVCLNSGITIDAKNRYFELMISTDCIDEIILQEQEVELGLFVLKDYIDNSSFAQKLLNTIESEKAIHLIEELGIKYDDLDIEGANSDIVDAVINYNHYKITRKNLEKVICYKSSIMEEDARTAIIKSILDTEDETFISYVESDFEKIVANYVVDSEQNVCETVESVSYIINKLAMYNIDLCFKVIKKQSVVWHDIQKCGDEIENETVREQIWEFLLENNRVDVTWDNFVKYYREYGLNQMIISFVSDNVDCLLQDFSFVCNDDELVELLNSNLSIEVFEKLVSNYTLSEFDESLLSLDEEKIKIMLNYEYVPFTQRNLNLMEQKSSDLAYMFIIQHLEELMKLVENFEISTQLYEKLLLADEIDLNVKKTILNTIDENIVDERIALAIRDLKFEVPKKLVNIAWDLLKTDKKYKLLLNQIDMFDDDELSIKFGELDEVYKQLSDRSLHKFIFADEKYNRDLLQKLRDRNYITSLKVEEDKVQNGKKNILTGMVRRND